MRKELRICAVVCFVLGGSLLGCSSHGSSSPRENPSAGPSVDDDDFEREHKIAAGEPADARFQTWQALTELDNETTTLAVGGTSTDQWINIGPSPQVLTSSGHTTYHAGRVAGVAVHPTNASLWLVAADRGGIWKTSDGGTTWTPTSDDQVTLHSQAIAFAKSNPTIVYANNGGGGSGGILKSTDTGSTWVLKATYPFSAGNTTRIRVSPTDPNVVLASIESDRDTNACGIWKSTDGGVTFPVRKLPGLAGTDLDYNPTNFNQQIGAIGNDAHSVYISRDAGETWTPVAHGTATWEKTGRNLNQVKVAIAPSDPNVAYIGADYSDDGTHHLWKTSNVWATTPTWSEVAATSEGFLGLLVDTANSGIVYHLGNGLFRVNGSTITHIDNLDTLPVDQSIHLDQRGAAWAGTRLVIGNDGGVYSTTNPAAATVVWTNHNTNAQGGATRLSIGQFWDGSLHPTNPNVALGGVLDDGSAKWTGTSDWREVLDADGFDNFFSTSAPDTMYACSFQNLGISRTKDDAMSAWTRPDLPDIPDTSYRPFVSKFERCPSNENVVAAGTDGIWLTTNFFSSTGSASWSQKVTVPSTSPDFHNDVFAIAFAPSDTTCKTIAYGGTNGRLFITKDQGTTWTNLDPSNQVPDNAARWPLASVTRLAFDPNNANVLYVALGGYDVDRPSTPGHLFKSTNALAATPSWVNVTPPAPAGDSPYDSVVVDPYDSNIVYVGTDLGIWRSTDAATTSTKWTHYGIAAGMPFVQVMDLEYQKSTDRLVAFTFGRGAFLFQPAIASAPTLSGSAGTGQAQMSWTSSLGARTYNLKRSQTAGGPYTLVRNQATTSFTDTGLAAGSYFYIVTAVNTTGESVNSNEVPITIAGASDPDRTEGGTATGTGTACNTTTETVAKAYDNLFAAGTEGVNWTKWCVTSAPSTTTPISTMYDFSGTTAFAITRYTITSGNDDATRDPQNWTFQGCQGTCTVGSDTGWTTLDTRTNQFPTGTARLQTISFSFTNTTAFQQYRLRVTANRGNTTRLQFAELQMFSGTCAPTTCAAQGKNCGSIGDGCGGNLNCGSCTAPQTCGGGGTANVCGCTPTTCSAQGKNCGSISDGCGANLNCGTCTSPLTCGGGGTANVCGGGTDPDRTEGGTPTGTGTACNTTTETVAKAYDNLFSAGTEGVNWTKWCVTSAPSTTTPISTMYDFSGTTAFAITRYTITTGNDDDTRDPRDWTFQGCQGSCTVGSDTGWTTLDTRTNQFPTGNTRLATTSFSFANTTAYQQYRLRVTANRGNTSRLQFAELQMFTGTCTPTTCAAQGKNCGTLADGCGGNLNCGTCTSPQTCGGGGTANVCGGGGGTACVTAYNVSNCNTYVSGTQVSNVGHNWTCSNGNCANCAVDTRCAPGGTGCPWGVVWTDNGTCQ